MNLFYSVPESVDTVEAVDKYYANRKYIMLLYDAVSVTDKTHEKFMSKITVPHVKVYYNITGYAHKSTIERNRVIGLQEYIAARARKPVGDEKKDIEEKFWNVTFNTDILNEFDRKQNNNSHFDPEHVLKFLQRHNPREHVDYILSSTTEYAPISIDDAIIQCEAATETRLKARWSLFNLFGYKCYSVVDERMRQTIGTVYVKIGPGNPQTIPLGKGMSLIKSPKHTEPNRVTHQLTHELVHGVQYCFNNFYDIPKEIVELPAMALENTLAPASSAVIQKTVALSIADILADDVETFDTIFKEQAISTPPLNVANRFAWHYINYPRQYYSYALGLLVKPQRGDIATWVRSPLSCIEAVQKLIADE